MFNIISNIWGKFKQNGLNALVYKTFKKTMYYVYRNQIGSNTLTKLPEDADIIYPAPSQFERKILIKDTDSKVSIFLIFEKLHEEAEKCFKSIKFTSSYDNYEIKVVNLDFSKSYSSKVNSLVRTTKAKFLIFISQPIEIINKDWIQEFLSCLSSPDAGIAGDFDLKTWNPSCYMISRALFEDVGGFNEYFFTPFANTDLCLRVQRRGKALLISNKSLFKHIQICKKASFYETMDMALLSNRWRIEVGK